MPHRAKRLPIPSSALQPYKLGELNWTKLEDAYDKKLDPEVRAKLMFATRLYLMAVPGEASAVPVSKFLKRLRQLEKTVAAVKADIVPKQLNRASRLPVELREIIDEFFDWDTDNQSHLSTALPVFSDVLDGVLAISALLRRELTHPGHEGFQKNKMFDFWVHWLTLIAREHGLPYQARKDAEKQKDSDGSSPFVALIRALQLQLPKEVRRFDSRDGIAQAIYRSRKRFEMKDKFIECLDDTLTEELNRELKRFRSISLTNQR